MTKPFSPSELVARVKAHLARYERLVGSGKKENDIVEIRGIKIDKTARRVWVNGEEKQFTTKEFDLLTFLAENPNRVFTKEELFREIWDMESIGDIATVTVHIKKIREKIEFNTAKPQYIETIWGVGYRFKAYCCPMWPEPSGRWCIRRYRSSADPRRFQTRCRYPHSQRSRPCSECSAGRCSRQPPSG